MGRNITITQQDSGAARMPNKLKLVVNNGRIEQKPSLSRHLKPAPDTIGKAKSVIRTFASALIDTEMPLEARNMLGHDISENEILASIEMLSLQDAFELYRDLSIAMNVGGSRLIKKAALDKLTQLDYLLEGF
jgi:hypothetical protein